MNQIKQHRSIYRVSALRQLITGGQTVYPAQVDGVCMINYAPCPTCHGNDRLSNIREGYGVLQVHCDRCKKDYWA
jgi:hypothetical protein